MADKPATSTRATAGWDLAILAAVYVAVYAVMHALDWRPLGTIIGPGFWAVVTSATILIVRYRRTRRPLSLAGLGRIASPVRALVSLVLALVATALAGNFLQPRLAAHFGAGTREAATRFQELPGHLGLTIFTLVVVAWLGAAVGEELVFRGLLMRGLERWWGGGRYAKIGAVLAQAVAFGAIHSYQGATGAIIAGSIGLIFGAAVYGAGGSLWPAVVIHAIPDTMTILRVYHG